MTRAIILAAGSGSRLMPLTTDRPKGMVTFLGETLLEAQIRVLRGWGIDDISVVVGYHAEAIAPLKLSHFHNEEYATTNMVSSLMCARALFDGKHDVVISYADIVYEPQVLKALLATNGDLAVVADRNWLDLWRARMDDPLGDAETFQVADTGAVAQLGRKPRNLEEIQGQYVGLIRLPAKSHAGFVAAYDGLDSSLLYDGRSLPQMFMTTLIQHLIDRGWLVMPAWIFGGWLEIDTIEDFERYSALHNNGGLQRLYRPAAPLQTELLHEIINAALWRYPDTVNLSSGASTALARLRIKGSLTLDELSELDELARKLEISGRLAVSSDVIDAVLALFLLAYGQTRDMRHINTVLKALESTLRHPRPSPAVAADLRLWISGALAS